MGIALPLFAAQSTARFCGARMVFPSLSLKKKNVGEYENQIAVNDFLMLVVQAMTRSRAPMEELMDRHTYRRDCVEGPLSRAMVEWLFVLGLSIGSRSVPKAAASKGLRTRSWGLPRDRRRLSRRWEAGRWWRPRPAPGTERCSSTPRAAPGASVRRTG